MEHGIEFRRVSKPHEFNYGTPVLYDVPYSTQTTRNNTRKYNYGTPGLYADRVPYLYFLVLFALL